MSSRAVITVAYDGPMITGAMDVRELAPALLEMGKLLEDANRVLNAETYKVNVLVKSDFRTGSFEVVLDVVQHFLDVVKNLLEIHKQGVDAIDLVKALGLCSTGIGLLKLLKWLRGRPIKNLTVLENGNTIVQVEGEHDPIEVIDHTMALFRDPAVRRGMAGLLKPLDSDGIDRFVVRERNEDVEVVTKEDRGYFAAPELPEEQIVDNQFTGAYTIVTTQFDEHLKWRLSQGENRITAYLKDEEFIGLIDKGIVSFTKGDVLLVTMRLRQWKGPEGLKSEYYIVKVLEHTKTQSYAQVPLPPEQPNEEANPESVE